MNFRHLCNCEYMGKTNLLTGKLSRYKNMQCLTKVDFIKLTFDIKYHWICWNQVV